jgi:predicted metal-dependent peptidase
MYAEAQGKMPGALTGMIDNLTKSTVRWQDYLKTKATKIFGRDRYSFRRYNRRGLAMNVRLPRAIPDGRSAVMWFDTSGSMSDDMIRQCFSEGLEIFHQCGASKLYVGCHDYEVYYFEEVASKELTQIKMGRGGTSHKDVFAILNGKTIGRKGKEFKIPKTTEVELAIMFTDLGTDFPSQRPSYDVIWAVPSNGCPGMRAEVPFGTKVEIDMEAMKEKRS